MLSVQLLTCPVMQNRLRHGLQSKAHHQVAVLTPQKREFLPDLCQISLNASLTLKSDVEVNTNVEGTRMVVTSIKRWEILRILIDEVVASDYLVEVHLEMFGIR